MCGERARICIRQVDAPHNVIEGIQSPLPAIFEGCGSGGITLVPRLRVGPTLGTTGLLFLWMWTRMWVLSWMVM